MAIYVDTDLIFMRPVEHLWNEFDNFDQNQVSDVQYLKKYIILVYTRSVLNFFPDHFGDSRCLSGLKL